MEGRRQDGGRGTLVGRSREQAALREVAERARGGQGGLVLVSGEAGIGKTRLVDSFLLAEGLPVLRGPSRDTRLAAPFSPIAAVLRAGLAASPGALDHLPLRGYLAPLLPELGPAPSQDGNSPAALHEAIRGALRALMESGPTALVLEDLQWADHATLDLLPALVGGLADRPVLVVGTFRSEELPRAHPLRRARQELRRAGVLEELHLGPLDPAETAELARARLGAPLTPALAGMLHARSEGVPLFVEELAAALRAGGGLAPDGDGHLDLAPGAAVEVPLTLREAIGLSLDRFPPGVRAAAELAAVLGPAFDADLLLDLADEQAFDALTGGGWLVEGGGGAAFRHALVRDAIYAGIPWARRRTLHRQVAARLEEVGAPPGVTAEHWLAGREPGRAREALLASAEASCRLHAYRDAAGAVGRALALWPPGAEEARRLEVLDQLGRCAQACGLLAEAGAAWREAAGARRAAGDTRGFAAAQHRLAGALELQGQWEEASRARRDAADAYAACGLFADAAGERLAVGAALRAASQCSAALDVLAEALSDARRAGRPDLEARILGQEGNARARLGQVARGLAVAREGLALALAGDHTAATVEVLHRIADSLEQGGDYAAARAAYEEAIRLCPADQAAAAAACRACLAVPLYQNGAWDRAAAECRAVLGSPASSGGARAVAGAMLGTVLAHRGQPSRARPLLLEALALGRQTGLTPVLLRALWGLALAEDAAGHPGAAAGRVRDLLEVWEGAEDHYHVLFALRWASSLFAGLGAGEDLRRAADALSRAADLNGGPVAFSALAHALGELAWFEDQPEAAANQFAVAAGLLRDTDTPFEEASTRLRAGQALAALGQRESALGELRAAHRVARGLHAVTLARNAARTLENLGEAAGERGTQPPRGAAAWLTRRQLEVLLLVARGRTDKAIARELRLSPRTVEMHVGNILASLDSRSRAEAVGRAAELGLLPRETGPTSSDERKLSR